MIKQQQKTIDAFLSESTIILQKHAFWHSFSVVKLCVEISALAVSKYFVSRGTIKENIWLNSCYFIKFKNIFD